MLPASLGNSLSPRTEEQRWEGRITPIKSNPNFDMAEALNGVRSIIEKQNGSPGGIYRISNPSKERASDNSSVHLNLINSSRKVSRPKRTTSDRASSQRSKA